MSASSPSSYRYCRSCGYNLHALPTPRCPECGRTFDPANPKTFHVRAPRPFRRALWRWTKRLACLLLILILIPILTWLYLYWGWHREQTIVREMHVIRRQFDPIGGEELYRQLYPGGFALDRFTSISVGDWQIPPDKEISSEKFALIKKLTRLRSLSIRSTTLTDADLANIKDLRELEDITINDESITDAGLVYLKDLRKLRSLRLESASVTGAGLIHLKDLSELDDLYLRGLKIDDAGLVHIKGLKKLRYLSLMDTKITDAGLIHLQDLKELYSVDMRGTKVTSAGVRSLKAKLPKLGSYDFDGYNSSNPP